MSPSIDDTMIPPPDRLTPWTPNTAQPIDPARCPLGCPLDAERRGICPDLADPATRGRPCFGYFATTCDAAFQTWKDAGGPSISIEDRRRLAPRREAEVPEPETLRLPAVLAEAPASLEAWTVTAADERHRRMQQDYREQAEAIVRSGWKAARASGRPWLLLLGNPGTGKTLLMRILGRSAAAAGLKVRYVLFEEMLKAVKATRAPESTEREEDVLEQFTRPDLLIIDDIRPVFASQDDENIAHDVIKARYATDLGEPQKMTWAAANLTVKELVQVIGIAAADRYLGGGTEPWFFIWPSYRQEGTP